MDLYCELDDSHDVTESDLVIDIDRMIHYAQLVSRLLPVASDYQFDVSDAIDDLRALRASIYSLDETPYITHWRRVRLAADGLRWQAARIQEGAGVDLPHLSDVWP